jgi:hypothetical protein
MQERYLKHVSSLPVQSWFDEVNEMVLLDDILLVKGHPKSEKHKNEKPYAKHERLNKIIKLMDINIQRTVHMHHKHNSPYTGDPITARRKVLKEEYKLGISLLHMERMQNFHERLDREIRNITREPYKKSYRGNVIPHPKGIYATAWTTVKKLVDVHTNTYREYPEKLGRISEEAVIELAKRNWPIEQEFEFIDEPILELCEIGISTDKRYPNPREYCKTGETELLVVIDGVMH